VVMAHNGLLKINDVETIVCVEAYKERMNFFQTMKPTTRLARLVRCHYLQRVQTREYMQSLVFLDKMSSLPTSVTFSSSEPSALICWVWYS
jgi:hypothetical protein